MINTIMQHISNTNILLLTLQMVKHDAGSDAAFILPSGASASASAPIG